LRFTTKFDGVGPLLDLPHRGRTRVRISVNAQEIAARFEGGTAALPHRIGALRELAVAGYRVGLTIAPIMPIPRWREGYRSLLQDVAAAVCDLPEVDLTVECITHRFTAGSKDVLLGWYPRTKLEMDESARTRKFGKYGSAKYVYPRDVMAELRSWFENELATTLPAARMLYWT
jgi:spore photoproduct lyase